MAVLAGSWRVVRLVTDAGSQKWWSAARSGTSHHSARRRRRWDFEGRGLEAETVDR